MIVVVVAGLETGVVVAALETRVDRAPVPLRLVVVVDPFVTMNKWTQNVARSQRRRQAQVDENIPSIMQI